MPLGEKSAQSLTWEETLYLYESGNLIFERPSPAAAESADLSQHKQVYHHVLQDPEKYAVYAHLKRLGFTVVPSSRVVYMMEILRKKQERQSRHLDYGFWKRFSSSCNFLYSIRDYCWNSIMNFWGDFARLLLPSFILGPSSALDSFMKSRSHNFSRLSVVGYSRIVPNGPAGYKINGSAHVGTSLAILEAAELNHTHDNAGLFDYFVYTPRHDRKFRKSGLEDPDFGIVVRKAGDPVFSMHEMQNLFRFRWRGQGSEIKVRLAIAEGSQISLLSLR